MSETSSFTLLTTPFATIARRNRALIATLHAPAQVLSTCPQNGGTRHDLTHLLNHQSCEGSRHDAQHDFITGLGPLGYHAHVCAEHALDPATTATMGTAANMHYLGQVTRTHADLAVTAIVTAGVTGNAASASDPSHYDEQNGKWEKVPLEPRPIPGSARVPRAESGVSPDSSESPAVSPSAPTHNPSPRTHHLPPSGTINTLLLLSSPFTAAALARAVVTLTEAKTAALLELAIGSKTSHRLATGTGTDQYIIACPQTGPAAPRTWTGHHCKAGELIGETVRLATLEALRWQNGLEPSYTRSALHALSRHGLREDTLRTTLAAHLTPAEHTVLSANWLAFIHDPAVSAGAYTLATLLDRAHYGTLPPSSYDELLLNHCALLAATLAQRPDSFAQLRHQLLIRNAGLPSGPSAPATDLTARTLALFTTATALGFRAKWSPPN